MAGTITNRPVRSALHDLRTARDHSAAGREPSSALPRRCAPTAEDLMLPVPLVTPYPGDIVTDAHARRPDVSRSIRAPRWSRSTSRHAWSARARGARCCRPAHPEQRPWMIRRWSAAACRRRSSSARTTCVITGIVEPHGIRLRSTRWSRPAIPTAASPSSAWCRPTAPFASEPVMTMRSALLPALLLRARPGFPGRHAPPWPRSASRTLRASGRARQPARRLRSRHRPARAPATACPQLALHRAGDAVDARPARGVNVRNQALAYAATSPPSSSPPTCRPSPAAGSRIDVSVASIGRCDLAARRHAGRHASLRGSRTARPTHWRRERLNVSGFDVRGRGRARHARAWPPPRAFRSGALVERQLPDPLSEPACAARWSCAIPISPRPTASLAVINAYTPPALQRRTVALRLDHRTISLTQAAPAFDRRASSPISSVLDA